MDRRDFINGTIWMGVAAVAAGCLAGKSIGGDSFDYLVSLESNQANYEACAKTEGGMRV